MSDRPPDQRRRAELLADAIADVIGGGADEAVALGRFAAHRDEMAAAMMPPVVVAAALPSDMHELQRSYRGMSSAMRAEWALIESGFGMQVSG